jgi:hypothetical protein
MTDPQPRAMTDDEKRKLGIPLKAEGTFLHIPKKEPEILTGGWTDDQIRAKSMQEIDAMIESGMKGVESLRATVRAEEARIDDLRRVKGRKLALGG